MGESGTGDDAEVPGPLSDADREATAADARRLYVALGRSWHGRVVWARSPEEFEALADHGVRRELLAGSDRWRAWRRGFLVAAETVKVTLSLIALAAGYGSIGVLAYALASLGEPSFYGVLERIGLRELVRPLDAPHGFVVAGWLFGVGAAGSLIVQSAGFVEALGPLDRVRPSIHVDPPPPRRGWRRRFRALTGTTDRDGVTVAVRSGTALASGEALTPKMIKQTAVLLGQAWSATPLVFLPRRGTASRRQQAIQASRSLRQRVFACAVFRHLVVVLEPPAIVRTEGSPHSPDAPALEWADGEAHDVVHGDPKP